MAIECKVSNSALNSIKRLNNDAAVKAEFWLKHFGTAQMVPAAVLSGVYKLHHLVNAQAHGLALFWAHDLVELLSWIDQTRSESMAAGRTAGIFNATGGDEPAETEGGAY